jgi:hypothetical protein
MVFTWCRRRRSCVSSLYLIYLVSLILRVYDIRCLWDISLGVPLPGFIYATRLEFYKCPSRIRIRTFLLRLQVIFESLCLSASITGQTRYTNPRVPKGHIHVTSYILIAGLLERDIFDLFLLEFDKPWVIHLRETCCYFTNLCTWRPNIFYKNRSVCRHQALFRRHCWGGKVKGTHIL